MVSCSLSHRDCSCGVASLQNSLGRNFPTSYDLELCEKILQALNEQVLRMITFTTIIRYCMR